MDSTMYFILINYYGFHYNFKIISHALIELFHNLCHLYDLHSYYNHKIFLTIYAKLYICFLMVYYKICIFILFLVFLSNITRLYYNNL